MSWCWLLLPHAVRLETWTRLMVTDPTLALLTLAFLAAAAVLLTAAAVAVAAVFIAVDIETPSTARSVLQRGRPMRMRRGALLASGNGPRAPGGAHRRPVQIRCAS